jgi:hypothetical protein
MHCRRVRPVPDVWLECGEQQIGCFRGVSRVELRPNEPSAPSHRTPKVTPDLLLTLSKPVFSRTQIARLFSRLLRWLV